MREQMSSQGLQSHVGRWEGCLPASLPAFLSLHKNTSCTRLVTVYIFLTLLEPSRAPGWCTVYSVSLWWGEVWGSCRTGIGSAAFGLLMTGLGAAEWWGRGQWLPVLSHPSVLKMPRNPCLSYRKFAHSSALAGASPWLSGMTNSRVQCPRGELKTTVN